MPLARKAFVNTWHNQHSSHLLWVWGKAGMCEGHNNKLLRSTPHTSWALEKKYKLGSWGAPLNTNHRHLDSLNWHPPGTPGWHSWLAPQGSGETFEDTTWGRRMSSSSQTRPQIFNHMDGEIKPVYMDGENYWGSNQRECIHTHKLCSEQQGAVFLISQTFRTPACRLKLYEGLKGISLLFDIIPSCFC